MADTADGAAMAETNREGDAVLVADLDTGALDPGPARIRRIVGVVVALTLVGGLLATVVVGREGGDPDADLRRVAGFLRSARSVHVDGLEEVRSGTGGDLGQSFTSRSRMGADLVAPSTAHVLLEDGESETELIRLDDVVYSRSGDDAAAREAAPWVAVSIRPDAGGDPGIPEVALMARSGAAMAMAAGAGWAATPGIGLGAGGFAVESLDDLERLVVALDGSRRIGPGHVRVEVPLRRLLEVVAPADEVADLSDLDGLDGTATIDVESSGDGRLDRLRTVVTSGGDGADAVASTTDLRFRAWDDVAAISAPSDDHIDHTPSFDEEALTTVGFVALAPRVVPPPLRLVGAVVTEGDEDDGTCDDVALSYADPAAEDESVVHSLQVTTTSASCAADESFTPASGYGFGSDPDEGEPLTVGPFSGRISRTSDEEYGESIDLRLHAGDVVVWVTSDVGEETTLAMLADLVPLDLATQPVTELFGLAPR
jgi:hypothetical protein